MQLADHFEVLLKNTVNLSLSSLETLDSRVDAIYNTLEADAELGPYVVDKIPQGSWAHETIIKPPGNNEFDADFMLLLDENPDWSDSPKTYIDEVYSALHRHSTYRAMPPLAQVPLCSPGLREFVSRGHRPVSQARRWPPSNREPGQRSVGSH